jgi:Caspase domain/Domain of unknown function (DUF4384)/Bacterial SH3 domain
MSAARLAHAAAAALAGLLALGEGAAMAAASEPGWLRQPQMLRRQPAEQAATVARLPAGSPLTVQERRPGWYRVHTAAGTGWVRMFSVGQGSPQTGGGTNAAASRDWRAPTSHALLLGVGGFSAAGIPPLPGVGLDLQSARAMALKMGVPAAQVSIARDASLTLDGLVTQVQQLADRVQPGDRVFLYFAGHGTRYRDTGRPGAPCVTSLVSHDGSPFTDSMLAEALALLADKTDKLFVFVDACYSGGAVAAPRGNGQTARFVARSGGDAVCGVPTNVVSRSLLASGARRWAARDNITYLSAARDTEVAFEEAQAGGFATRSVRDCALRDARDTDGSGQVSLGEIVDCAQQRIDGWLAGSQDFRPQHLTVLGNRDLVPVWAAVAPAAPSIAAPAAPPTVAPAAPAVATAAPAAVAPASVPAAALPVRPERTLRDIYSQRDDRRQVTLKLLQSPLRVGRDPLAVSLVSSHPGYLYLLYAGSDGRSFDMLFPNQLDRDNRVLAGRPVLLPRPGWAIESRGPAGTNHLLAIVADAPRDFSGLLPQPTGVFSSVPASPETARLLAQGAVQAVAGAPGICVAAAASAPGPHPCSNGFGAALVEVHERP